MNATDDAPARRAQAALARGGAATVRAALDPVLQRHKPRMLRLFLHLTGDPARARALTRTALRRAYRELPQLGDERTWLWLFRLTRRLAMEAVRQRSEPLLEDGVYLPRDPGWQILRGLSRAERRTLLQEVSARLDPEVREATYLRYAESLPVPAIQRVLRVQGARESLARVRRDLGRDLDRRLLG